MRHKKTTKTIGRTSGPRQALLRSLAISLITEEKITTTPTKARALKQLVESMVTTAKVKSPHTIRLIEKKLANKAAAMKLVNTLGPRYANRPGGYTRLIHTAPRKGDGAQQVIMQFVESK